MPNNEFKYNTEEINRGNADRRDKDSLDSVSGGILREKGHVPADTADGWKIVGDETLETNYQIGCGPVKEGKDNSRRSEHGDGKVERCTESLDVMDKITYFCLYAY